MKSFDFSLGLPVVGGSVLLDSHVKEELFKSVACVCLEPGLGAAWALLWLWHDQAVFAQDSMDG